MPLLLRRRALGRHDEVALVLAVLVGKHRARDETEVMMRVAENGLAQARQEAYRHRQVAAEAQERDERLRALLVTFPADLY